MGFVLMHRGWLTFVVVVLAVGAIPATGYAAELSHRFEGGIDASWVKADSSLESWLYRGSGKLRYDEAHDGLVLNRGFVDYHGRIAPEWSAVVSLSANNDVADKLDILEAFVAWRPVPSSRLRMRMRLGAFYPRLSLENVDAGWSTPYSLTSSAINTWIAEELRTIGAELRLVYDVPGRIAQQVAVEGSVYGFNDPTGAVLTWRGWSVHDRQTGVNGYIPMPRISAIEPWNSDGQPVPRAEPFKEIDGRPGLSVGAEWRVARRALIRVFHYDNHADPEAVSGDDYAWRTWFDHIGVQLELPFGVGLLGQWIDGSTRMGPDLGPWRVQDVDYDSAYLLLTRALGSSRFSARYEWFDLQPFNDPAGITNQDKGNSYALSWLYSVNESVRVGAEFMQIRSTHCRTPTCFWVFNGLPRKTNESQLLVSVRWRFGSAGN